MEFLVDADRNFYFLEMNTRLQVEHPVTELVTGLDLVKLQISVAAGEALPFAQEDVTWRGSAIEVRIYAEDPDNNFFPSPGRITALVSAGGPGVRTDSGVYQDWTVPLEYDPLIAKLVGWGGTREEAIQRLSRALEECLVAGIKTNIPFFKRLLRRPEFLAGQLDTGFIDRMLDSERGVPSDMVAVEADLASVAAALYTAEKNGNPTNGGPAVRAGSQWKLEGRRSRLRNE
jgi:acetyl-CoA carboxylase biotin carboxylase subunit